MALPINSEYLDVIFAGMWVSIATSIPVGNDRQLIPSIAIKLLILGAALCSLWGRLSDYYMHVGSLPYATADALVIAAMLLIGWSLRHDVIDRISELSHRRFGMVGDSALRGVGPLADKENIHTSEKSEALHAPKVRAHG